MINVESIWPYIIVKNEDGFYGITDNAGNLIVPCIMDEISNSKDDEIGLDHWTDFFCVLIIKNSKYGFFTKNGKFIEPAYENYTVDPCGGDIHVKTSNGYGVLSAPDYIFEEESVQCSLLAEILGEDFDEDFED
jgi:hypothetical protein